jgi:hypothetical protein
MANSAIGVRAERTEVTLRSKTMVLDFAGECRVEGDGDAARLAGLRLVAELPDAGGPEDGGTVVLEQDEDSGAVAFVAQPGGRVELTTRRPVRWAASGSGPVFATDDQIEFVLPQAGESTVLLVRGLALTAAEPS